MSLDPLAFLGLLGMVLLFVGPPVLILYVMFRIVRAIIEKRRDNRAEERALTAAGPAPDFDALVRDLDAIHGLPAISLDANVECEPEQETDSCIGVVLVLGEDEKWPLDSTGAPMVGLMQLNLTGITNRPAELEGLVFLSVFMGANDEPPALVREYANLDRLYPVKVPESVMHGRHYAVSPREFRSPPTVEFLESQIPGSGAWPKTWSNLLFEAHERLSWERRVPCHGVLAVQLGGWQAMLIVENDPNPVTLELIGDYDSNLGYIGDGSLCLRRVRRGEKWTWETDWQFS